MEICPVSSIVCLVKPKNSVDKTKSQQIIVSPDDQEFSLILNDSLKNERSWSVTNAITPENNEAFITETKQLLNLALQGYNVSSLFMSQGERGSLYDQRRKDLGITLDLLKEAVEKSNLSVRYEYAYVGLDDTFTYDLQKEKERSNDRILKRGLESIMKHVDSLDDIWAKASAGSILPFALSIKITDLNTSKQGRFQLFDMLVPSFSPPAPNAGRSFYESFSYLVEMAKTLSAPYRGHLPTDTNVLTHLLSHCLSGHEKLGVFLYLNDYVQQKRLNDTVALLDFAATLKHIPIRALPEMPVIYTREYKKLMFELTSNTEIIKDKENKTRAMIVSMETEVAAKNGKIDFLESLLKVRESQINYLEACYDEVQNKPNIQILKLQQALEIQKNRNKDLEFQYQLSEMQSRKFVQTEKPSLENALIASHQKVEQLEQRLAESNYKTNQLEQYLEEVETTYNQSKQALEQSDNKCAQLAEQLEMLKEQLSREKAEGTVNSEQLQMMKRRLQEEYDEKQGEQYQEMYAAYKKKLETIKFSYKETIEKMKTDHEEDLEIARDLERMKVSNESKQLQFKLEALQDKFQMWKKNARQQKTSSEKVTVSKRKAPPRIDSEDDYDFVPQQKTSTAKLAPSKRKAPARNDSNDDHDETVRQRKTSPPSKRKAPLKADSDDNHDENVPQQKITKATPSKRKVSLKVDSGDDYDGHDHDHESENIVDIEAVDDLNEATAYIMEFDSAEQYDQQEQSTCSTNKKNEPAKKVLKKRGRKPKDKPPVTPSSPSPLPPPSASPIPDITKSDPPQKTFIHSDDDDFASPTLPLAANEPTVSETTDNNKQTLIPLIDEEDAVALVKPIQPRRKVRKLTKPIPDKSPYYQRTETMLVELEEARDKSQSYDLKPVQEQAQQSLQRTGSSSNLQVPSAEKREAKTKPPVANLKKKKAKANANALSKTDAKAKEDSIVDAIRSRRKD